MLFASVLATLAVAASVHATPVKRALPRLGGVNLAGCDFGMNTDGWSGNSYCPGTDQIDHFVSKGANLIRLPVGWQYLVGNDQASTSLDQTFFATYDNLVRATLDAGAYAMIDVHNYARWNGGVIGQGGPSNENFASLWKLLAAQYKDEPKVIFGIMNEPHDMPDNAKWAVTVQAAVDAIRDAGATSQTIALPGTGYAHAGEWFNGGNAALLDINDKATGDASLIVLDIHKYLDSDSSGTHTECTTDGLEEYKVLQKFLTEHDRRALISEVGGGDTDSCRTDLGALLNFVATNDEFLGFAVWSAGSFSSSYELSIVPVNGEDNELFKQAIQPHLPGAATGSVAPSATTTNVSTLTSAATTTGATSSSKVDVPPSSTSALVSGTTPDSEASSTGTAAAATSPTAIDNGGLRACPRRRRRDTE